MYLFIFFYTSHFIIVFALLYILLYLVNPHDK